MNSHQLAACVVVVFSLTTFAAAPPARPLGSAELQQLIEQLGDRDYRVRDAAERRILTEGFPALPLLRKAMGHKDPEVRRRALRMVPGLEHAALVAPKRVTLSVRNQPMRFVLEEISKQTGYKIQHQGQMIGGRAGIMLAPAVVVIAKAAKGKVKPRAGDAGTPAAPGEPTFSYSWVNEPFWNVLDKICRDGNLVLQQGWGDEIVRLYQGTAHSRHVGHDGAFRYSATNMQLYRNIDLSSGTGGSSASRTETLTLNLTLFAEPRLPFLGIGEARIEAAYDTERNSMIPRPQNTGHHDEFGGLRMGRRYHGGGYKQMSIQTSLSLSRVSEKASAIKLLRGVVPVTLLVEQKPVDLVDDVLKAKGVKKTVGDLDFSVESVQKKQNNQYEIKFTVTNKGNPNDYMWQNTLYQRIELLDAKGNKYQNWGSNWHGGGNNSVTLTMTYNGSNAAVKPGDPRRFVYQHWVTRQHDVHFELRDVPLP